MSRSDREGLPRLAEYSDGGESGPQPPLCLRHLPPQSGGRVIQSFPSSRLVVLRVAALGEGAQAFAGVVR